ncbi:hypothetical protein CCU68_25285 [Pseudomonas gingeri NCPPB 3146 = LMG 5327]|uniref:Uncharacterized protein n=2 Tax=Pseudomonas gingeri TaxID=117681 RepID=A0A7Y8CBZ1_9PSED|nr:hypothetical protein [Pseudomonas gingeri]NWC13274.1 hypothetical protein [Pseudomonas gingeri]PNQ89767.1 hypothetical protein CCU68_25285 [Pseudomonas gingeri NCPPB 3146 = LMG 5327]
MSNELSEEEMRLALFGTSSQSSTPAPMQKPEPKLVATPSPTPPRRTAAKSLSPKLRVTLHATREFEGEIEVLTYDANTLSTFTAEQEAKNEAKKKKFRYFDVVSINPI